MRALRARPTDISSPGCLALPSPLSKGRSDRFLSCAVALLLLLGLFFSGHGAAQSPPLLLEQRPLGQRADGHLSILRDPSGLLRMEDVQTQPFSPLLGQASFGFTKDTIWLKLDLQLPLNPSDEEAAWWLEVALPSLDDVRLYLPDFDGHYRMTHVGDHLPFAQRPLAHRLFLFPLPLQGAGPHALYLRVATADSFVVPIRLWHSEALRDRLAHENLWLGISYGLILGMLIYNAFLWSVLRDALYGFYVTTCLTSLLVILELNGHAYQYLWPTNLWLAEYQHVVVPAMHFFVLSWWTRRFLDTPSQAPYFDWMLKGVMAAALGMLGLAMASQYTLGNLMAFWVGMAMTLLALMVTLRVAWRGYRPAYLFLLAQCTPLVGALITLARALGFLPDSLWAEHAFQIGISLEMMLFSLALAQRIELLHEEKRVAQHHAETDPLTGLFNRNGFLSRVSELNAKQLPYGLLLIDLDRFKPVNDRLGHEAGDTVLKAVAERLRAVVRTETDTIARIGGDEFVVAVPGITHEREAGRIAAEMVERLAIPVPTPAGEACIGASIGIAFSPADGHELKALLHVADQAMYHVKHAGRNGWHYNRTTLPLMRAKPDKGFGPSHGTCVQKGSVVRRE
jgi:two-component system, sensor histidine kinase LadS